MVGEDCVIASVVLVDGARIGDRCRLQHAAALGPGAWLGCDVFIGPHVIICNDMFPQAGKTGFDIDSLRDKKCVVIADGASVGAHAVILPGVTIGAGAVIAAAVAVDRDVPADHLFRRDGRIVPIDPERALNRMRLVRPPS